MAKALIALVLQLLLLAPLAAQVLRDPTQPPPAYMESGSGPADDEVAPLTARTLQSIVRRHGAKPLAVINGQNVRLGGRLDEWTLVRIGEAEVELKGPGGRETLMLSPAVDKQRAKPLSVRRQR